MGHNLCCHSTMNNHHCGNIFSLIQLALDREIQGLSFDAWYTVELKVVNWSFCRQSKIHVFCTGEGMVWNSEVFWSSYFTKVRLHNEY